MLNEEAWIVKKISTFYEGFPLGAGERECGAGRHFQLFICILLMRLFSFLGRLAAEGSSSLH